MGEQTTSQVQQAQQTWKKVLEDHMTRVEELHARMARAEAENAERTRSAVDEAARLSKETLKYACELSAEWRKLTLEATRNAIGLWTSQG